MATQIKKIKNNARIFQENIGFQGQQRITAERKTYFHTFHGNNFDKKRFESVVMQNNFY